MERKSPSIRTAWASFSFRRKQAMQVNQEMEAYLAESQEELRQLIRDLCAIPAPSHHEERRAEFCKRFLEENGGENVVIDEALNVICPYGVTEGGDVVVFMAHTDTVFPDQDPMPFREEGRKILLPWCLRRHGKSCRVADLCPLFSEEKAASGDGTGICGQFLRRGARQPERQPRHRGALWETAAGTHHAGRAPRWTRW